METKAMKLKFVSENTLTTMKRNPKSLYNHVFVNNESLDSFIGGKSILEYPLEYPELNFEMQNEDRVATDLENIKNCYGSLKDVVSDSLAADERVWTGMIFSDAFEYMKYRWPATDAEKMNNRYFFAYSNQRSLFRNGLARLWWIGRLTYEEDADDHYCRTKYLVSKQDIIESFCGRTIFNNPTIFKASVVILQNYEEKGISFNREFIRDIAQYINMLGGVYILDALPIEDFATKVEKYIIDNYRKYE